MTFISYAQNYEDLILWRALRGVERGFYVDVGAADPEVESVTRAFYELGWCGINIEPLEEHFIKLKQARPRDTNLKLVVGRESGVRVLHAFPGTGLSTVDAKIARTHEANGFSSSEIMVPTLPLTKIIEDCAPGVIHFLKIDVEGAEAEVLESLALDRIRPWVIVVEASEPLSTASTRTNWERLITDRGYDFAYFDGLNCFYVADEVAALKERLAVPPNFFDDYMRVGEWNIRQTAAKLEQEVAGFRERLRGLEAAQAERVRGLEAAQAERVRGLEAAQAERVRGLEAALQEERAHAAYQRSAKRAAQEQLRALQGQETSLHLRLDDLSKRIHFLSSQLTSPSVDRALGRALSRARETGNRLTGGGLRSLFKRVLPVPIRSATVNSHVTPLANVESDSLPSIASKREPAAAFSIPSSTESADSDVAAIPVDLPASARPIYKRLRTVISDNEPWNRVQ